MPRRSFVRLFFFFNDTATTEIYTLSLHDALPIWLSLPCISHHLQRHHRSHHYRPRSEEHTSELQSRLHLVCRLLLEKKNKTLHTTGRCTPLRPRPHDEPPDPRRGTVSPPGPASPPAGASNVLATRTFPFF